MNSWRDRVIAQIQHQETDPIPYTLGVEGDVAERLDAYYGSDAWRGLIENAIHQIPGPQLVIGETSERYYVDPYGSRWDVQGRPFHLVEPVLSTPSLKKLVFPDLDALIDRAWKNEATDTDWHSKYEFSGDPAAPTTITEYVRKLSEARR